MGSALGAQVADGPLPVELVRVGLRDPARPRAVPLPPGVEGGSVAELLADDEPRRGGRADRRDRRAAALGRATLARGAVPTSPATRHSWPPMAASWPSWRSRADAALLGSASVGGGTPMIETVTEHLATSGGVDRIRGLLNATTTFILAAMADGRSYDDCPARGPGGRLRRSGPHLRRHGRDAAQKIAILAWVAWGRWLPEQRSRHARYRRHPRRARRGPAPRCRGGRAGLRVGPMALGADDPMAGVSGIECLLEVQLREGAIFRLAGPGAGGPVSVRATYADLGACWPASGRSSSHRRVAA